MNDETIVKKDRTPELIATLVAVSMLYAVAPADSYQEEQLAVRLRLLGSVIFRLIGSEASFQDQMSVTLARVRDTSGGPIVGEPVDGEEEK